MNQAPVVDPAEREGASVRTGALPVVLYVFGVLAAVIGFCAMISGEDAGAGGSAFIGGILLYAAGDVVRSLRLMSGRCTRG